LSCSQLPKLFVARWTTHSQFGLLLLANSKFFAARLIKIQAINWFANSSTFRCMAKQKCSQFELLFRNLKTTVILGFFVHKFRKFSLRGEWIESLFVGKFQKISRCTAEQNAVNLRCVCSQICGAEQT
jgi:hypothetical protein